jgi:hypothetical protein
MEKFLKSVGVEVGGLLKSFDFSSGSDGRLIEFSSCFNKLIREIMEVLCVLLVFRRFPA